MQREDAGIEPALGLAGISLVGAPSPRPGVVNGRVSGFPDVVELVPAARPSVLDTVGRHRDNRRMNITIGPRVLLLGCLVALAALGPLGCSISTSPSDSSESSSDSSGSLSDSSGSSSPSSKEAQYRNDVRDFTAAYVKSGGRLEDFKRRTRRSGQGARDHRLGRQHGDVRGHRPGSRQGRRQRRRAATRYVGKSRGRRSEEGGGDSKGLRVG